MKYEIHLKQQSRKGGNKVLLIRVDDGSNVIYREWGLEGKKMQTSTKEVQGKNIGKSNETSPHEQAVIEAKAITTRKIKEGYRNAEDAEAQEESREFQFDPLPENFCPSKPINDPPKGVSFAGGYEGYFAERKNNGVNLLQVTDLQGAKHTYTRGIKDITHLVDGIPEIRAFNQIETKPGSIISYEFVYYNALSQEVPKDMRGIVNERTSAEKAKARYQKLVDGGGRFKVIVFDCLFWNNHDVTGWDYQKRRFILDKVFFEQHPELKSHSVSQLTPDIIQKAADVGWEGWILRKLTGPESTIEYTMNGKPYRRGAWKFKYEYTDDYIIWEAALGDAGRLKGKLAKFHLGKYDDDGTLISCGWAGPGNIPTEELDDLATKLGVDTTKMLPGNVVMTEVITVEVKFQSKQPGSNALEFPVIRELRPDKEPKECLLEDKPVIIGLPEKQEAETEVAVAVSNPVKTLNHNEVFS